MNRYTGCTREPPCCYTRCIYLGEFHTSSSTPPVHLSRITICQGLFEGDREKDLQSASKAARGTFMIEESILNDEFSDAIKRGNADMGGAAFIALTHWW